LYGANLATEKYCLRTYTKMQYLFTLLKNLYHGVAANFISVQYNYRFFA